MHIFKLKSEIDKMVDLVEGRKTKEFREIAKMFKPTIKQWDVIDIYELCEQLLKENKRGQTIIAYQIIYDNKSRFTEETYDVLQKFVYKYIRDWWDCDDLMTHAFYALLKEYPQLINKTGEWVKSEHFAVRRSAAVVLIRLAQSKHIEFTVIKAICDRLISDEHYLVQKGYGWLLKESTKHYRDEVIDYLKLNVKNMPRVAFRYALEKLPKSDKDTLMKL